MWLIAAVGDAGAVLGGDAVTVALLLAEITPAPAVGDVAELGDVDVDQRPGVRVLVASDQLAGDPVDARQPVDAAAGQHRVHRRGGHPDLSGDLHRAEPLAPAQAHDLLHDGLWRLGRAGSWGASYGRPSPPAPLSGSGRPYLPAVRGEDHEHLRRLAPAPAFIDDKARQPQPSTRGQSSVSVGHEGLTVSEAVPRQLHFTTRGPSPVSTTGRHQLNPEQRPWTSQLAAYAGTGRNCLRERFDVRCVGVNQPLEIAQRLLLCLFK